MTTLIVLSIIAFYTPADIPLRTSVRIAVCESKLDPNARNPHSTAKGIYQFTDGTWQHYCTGDVFNARDNIRCFMLLYPKHKNWWQCK